MNAGLNLMFVGDPLDEITVTDVALIKRSLDAERVTMATTEIVQDDNLLLLRPQ